MGGELFLALFPRAFDKGVLVESERSVFEDDDARVSALDDFFDLSVVILAGRVVERDLDFVFAKFYRLHLFGRIKGGRKIFVGGQGADESRQKETVDRN